MKSNMSQTPETEVVDVPSQKGTTNVTQNDREDAELTETSEEVCEEELYVG